MSRNVAQGKREIVLELCRVFNFGGHKPGASVPCIVRRDLRRDPRVAMFGKVALECLQALTLPLAHAARAAGGASRSFSGLGCFACIRVEAAVVPNNELLKKAERHSILIKLNGDEANGAIANVDTNSVDTFSHVGPFCALHDSVI